MPPDYSRLGPFVITNLDTKILCKSIHPQPCSFPLKRRTATSGQAREIRLRPSVLRCWLVPLAYRSLVRSVLGGVTSSRGKVAAQAWVTGLRYKMPYRIASARGSCPIGEYESAFWHCGPRRRRQTQPTRRSAGPVQPAHSSPTPSNSALSRRRRRLVLRCGMPLYFREFRAGW